MSGKSKHALSWLRFINQSSSSIVDETLNANLDLDPGINEKAMGGDSSAQLIVGKANYHAIFIEDSCYSAFGWIELSAYQENVEAQFRLADMYALGHGVDRDILYALEWYIKSALQDYSKALIRIHNLYQEDRGIHCRGELNPHEEGIDEPEFKNKHTARESNEYRLEIMKTHNLLGCTVDYFTNQFKKLMKSNTDDKNVQYYIGFLYRYGYGISKCTKHAIEWYTKAAEQGHINAQYNLGCLYQQNTDIKFNYRHAFKWYEIAAESGNSSAQRCLGSFYEKGFGVELDLSKALHWYTMAAENNNKDAMLSIARIYRKGLAGTPDYTQSAEWYTAAAKQGSLIAKSCLYVLNHRGNLTRKDLEVDNSLVEHESSSKSRLYSRLRLDISNYRGSSLKASQLKKLASNVLVGDMNAMLELAFKYCDGSDLIQDKDIGFRWMKKAAKMGHITAQIKVAKMYEEGIAGVVMQDYKKAFIWYSLAAKKSDSVAQYHVGLMYYKGQGVRKDALEASKWFTWSADQGNSDSQYMLGVLRHGGEGLRKNLLKSYEWYTKSASQKNVKALYELGTIYWEGKRFENDRVIEEDREGSMIFYKYSANHGNLDAQLLLAKMYENGDYVEESFTEAFKYYLLAAEGGNSEAKYKAGWMYFDGKGVTQNYKEAFKWLSEARVENHQGAKDLFTLSTENLNLCRLLELFIVVNGLGIASLEYEIGYIYEIGSGYSFSNDTLFDQISINLKEAQYWYSKADEKNNPKAMYRLGKMYEEGKGVPRDSLVANYFYFKSAELKDIESLNTLAALYFSGVRAEYDSSKAFYLYFSAASRGNLAARKVLSILYESEKNNNRILMDLKTTDMIEKVASEGNTFVQYRLGIYYESRIDMKSAIKWYEPAAKRGLTEACYRLGRIHENKGEHQNYLKAIKFYLKAIDNGHDKSMYRLAAIYHRGIGVKRDYLKAFKLYTKSMNIGNKSSYRILNITMEIINTKNNEEDNSHLIPTSEEFRSSLSMYEHVAKHGNVNAQFKVGYVYEMIIDSPNYEKSVEWYTLAASSSHCEAAYRLGVLYSKGLGVSQDWSRSIKYLNEAAKLLSSTASFELGLIYHYGRGVEINKTKAHEYYCIAAERGNSNAQFTLGRLYEEDESVQQNTLEAEKWYRKAYLQDDKDAVNRISDLNSGMYCNKFSDQKIHSMLDRYSNRDHRGCTERYCGFCGYVNYQLGVIYFYGIGAEISYIKAWYHFSAANRKHNNRNALEFMTYEDRNTINFKVSVHCKKLEMFNEMVDDIDNKQQLYDLGMLFYNGKCLVDDINSYIIEPDTAKACKFLSKSVEKGYLKPLKLLGELYFYGLGVDTDYEKGLKYHITWANSQDSIVNFQTGHHYYNILSNSTTNKWIAFIYFNIAVNQKHQEAQQYLDEAYYTGQEALLYREKEITIHEINAEMQNQDKNTKVGLLYYRGTDNIKVNYFIAIIYFKKSSKKGDAKAMQFLGDIYYYGYGIEKDVEKAVELYKSSAKNHTQYENSKIGQGYYKGSEFIKKNTSIAFIYLNKAVDQGSLSAQRYLENMYYNGDGAEKDMKKAAELYNSSAENQQ